MKELSGFLKASKRIYGDCTVRLSYAQLFSWNSISGKLNNSSSLLLPLHTEFITFFSVNIYALHHCSNFRIPWLSVETTKPDQNLCSTLTRSINRPHPFQLIRHNRLCQINWTWKVQQQLCQLFKSTFLFCELAQPQQTSNSTIL